MTSYLNLDEIDIAVQVGSINDEEANVLRAEVRDRKRAALLYAKDKAPIVEWSGKVDD